MVIDKFKLDKYRYFVHTIKLLSSIGQLKSYNFWYKEKYELFSLTTFVYNFSLLEALNTTKCFLEKRKLFDIWPRQCFSEKSDYTLLVKYFANCLLNHYFSDGFFFAVKEIFMDQGSSKQSILQIEQVDRKSVV